MYAGTDERRIVAAQSLFINESRCEVEDTEIESTSRWIGESKIPESIV